MSAPSEEESCKQLAIEYDRNYLFLLRSLAQTLFVAAVSADTFGEFPVKLPEDARSDYNELLYVMAAVAKQNGALDDVGLPPFPSTGRTTEQRGKYFRYLSLLFSSLEVPSSPVLARHELFGDFATVIVNQTLVTCLAYMEAFLADTVLTVCRARPETLRRSKKTITWETALQYSDRHALIEFLIEELTYEHGWKNLRDRMTLLKNEFDLGATINRDHLSILESFEYRRNVIVHAGGRANRRYLELSRDAQRKIGDSVSPSLDELYKLAQLIGSIAGDIWEDVSRKLLDRAPERSQRRWPPTT